MAAQCEASRLDHFADPAISIAQDTVQSEDTAADESAAQN
jgi:hypothetical protein